MCIVCAHRDGRVGSGQRHLQAHAARLITINSTGVFVARRTRLPEGDVTQPATRRCATGDGARLRPSSPSVAGAVSGELGGKFSRLLAGVPLSSDGVSGGGAPGRSGPVASPAAAEAVRWWAAGPIERAATASA